MTRQENSVGIKGEVHHRWYIKSTSSDALRGTFLAMAVRVAIEKWLGGVSADAIKSLIEKNVGAETIWEMIPRGFRQSMFVYANEYPNQLRYVLNPVWVVEAIREANRSTSLIIHYTFWHNSRACFLLRGGQFRLDLHLSQSFPLHRR